MRVVSEFASAVEFIITQPANVVMKDDVLVDCCCGLELFAAPRTGMCHALLTQATLPKKSC
jgi:hypothetical protein